MIAPVEALGHCQWWALCGADAITTRSHPILGEVPICDRCHQKAEALS